MNTTCNKENMRLWVDALRSGEYEQGYGALLNDGKYCCLGVACEVAILNGVELAKEPVDSEYRPGRYAFGKETSLFLPGKVQEWLGIDSQEPGVFNTVGIAESVIHLNDSQKKDFSYIADALERTFLVEPDEVLA